jgi:hypothetical protein
MRTLSVLALTLALTGCGILGSAADLTPIEVAGRYAFTEYTVEPTAGSVDSRDLEDELGDGITLILTETGEARIERLRNGVAGEALASGVFAINGSDVTVTFRDLGTFGDMLMPRTLTFEADGSRLRAETFLQNVNLEELSDDYRGITRADVNLKIELREIGA